MLKIGYLGFGQAGSLFADVARKEGFHALAFNTAQVDLDVLDHLESSDRIHLSGFEGAGKNRDIGLEAFTEHEDMIKETISNKFHDFHILMPVFALGGGTGSGMAPSVVNLLTSLFETKVIAPILLLPHDRESLRAKMNTLEAFAAISENEDIGATFVFDNQKINDMYPSFTISERYDKLRETFIKLVKCFNEATERHSRISNLDAMDLLTVFSERGCALFSDLKIEEKECKNPAGIGERLLHSLEFSSYATTDYSHLSKVAVIGEYPEDFTRHITVDALFENISIPLEVFTGIYPTDESDNESKLYSLTTGLPFPNNRLKQYEATIQQEEQNVIKSLTIAREQQYQNKKEWTDSLKAKRRIRI
ncbi:hypothetical protein CN918_27365 [Priestia megaterium]|nr:hypothetical protein CN918_27365 [Priestia megaterium]